MSVLPISDAIPLLVAPAYGETASFAFPTGFTLQTVALELDSHGSAERPHNRGESTSDASWRTFADALSRALSLDGTFRVTVQDSPYCPSWFHTSSKAPSQSQIVAATTAAMAIRDSLSGAGDVLSDQRIVDLVSDCFSHPKRAPYERHWALSALTGTSVIAATDFREQAILLPPHDFQLALLLIDVAGATQRLHMGSEKQANRPPISSLRLARATAVMSDGDVGGLTQIFDDAPHASSMLRETPGGFPLKTALESNARSALLPTNSQGVFVLPVSNEEDFLEAYQVTRDTLSAHSTRFALFSPFDGSVHV